MTVYSLSLMFPVASQALLIKENLSRQILRRHKSNAIAARIFARIDSAMNKNVVNRHFWFGWRKIFIASGVFITIFTCVYSLVRRHIIIANFKYLQGFEYPDPDSTTNADLLDSRYVLEYWYIVEILLRTLGMLTGLLIIMFLYSFIVRCNYPLKIMQELTNGIASQNLSDIYSWWELRQYYIHFEFYLFSTSISSVVLAIILVALSSLGFGFYLSVIIGNKESGYILITVSLISSVFLAILIKKNVKVFDEQQHHIPMLHQEQLYLKNSNNMNSDTVSELIEEIKNLIIQYDTPIKILGLPMTKGFFNILGAYIIAAGLAIGGNLLWDWTASQRE